MVTEVLCTGKENAQTSSELAAVLNCDLRRIMKIIETERQAGKPICAAYNGNKPGYYLPECKEEVQDYCESLKRRAISIFDTMHAVEKAGRTLPARADLADK